MKIYITRHGQTTWNASRKIQGQSDEGVLDETGISQAEGLREKIRNIEFDAVFSSPLRRARKTAEIAVGDRNVIVFDERLMERGYGEFEGVDYGAVEDFYDQIWDFEAEDLSEFGGIEPISEIFLRVEAVVQEIKEKYPDGNVLIVCHGGVLRIFHYVLSGLDKNSKLANFYTDNCQVREYEI